jgi:threonine/homoserine/homoserine lactone efflux protein
MSTPLLSGTLLGLAAGVAPGPLLALVVSQTLRFGTAEGLKVAAAPLISDLPIVAAALFLLSQLAGTEGLLGAISLAGGGYVAFLAWESLRSDPSGISPSGGRPKSWMKGALVNFLNPHPYLFWLTVGGPLVVRESRKDALSPWLFVLGFYIMLVGAKLAIALATGRFRGFLSSRAYRTALRILGLALAGFAVLLVWDGISYLLT